MNSTTTETALPLHTATPFDLVVFDWDGTVFDSTAHIAHAIQRAVEDVGGTPPSLETARSVIGLGLEQALAQTAPDVSPDRYEELSRRYLWHYARGQSDITLFNGIRELLAALRQRPVRLAVATGKSRRGLDEALEQSGLGAYFHTTRTADETRGKPHPQMLLEILEELDCQPQSCLMVGDTTYDLQLAANAGCASVAVCYGAHAPHRFEGYSPLFTAQTVAELDAFLRQHTPAATA